MAASTLSEAVITFQCGDEKDVTVPQRLLLAKNPETNELLPYCSSYLHDMLGDDREQNEIVPLRKASSTTIQFLIKFIQLHETTPLVHINFPLARNGAHFHDHIGPDYMAIANAILDYDKQNDNHVELLASIYIAEYLAIPAYFMFLKGLIFSLLIRKTAPEVLELMCNDAHLPVPGLEEEVEPAETTPATA